LPEGGGVGDICRRGEAQRHLPEGVGAGDICRRTTEWATFNGGCRSGRHLPEDDEVGDICRRTKRFATQRYRQNSSEHFILPVVSDFEDFRGARDTGKSGAWERLCR